jgi:hypothetical protein
VLHATRIGATVLLAVVGSGAAWPAGAQTSTREHVEILASDRFEGREAGSLGERRAAEYLAAELAAFGARPLPGLTGMLVPFEFTAGSRDAGSRLSIERTAVSGEVRRQSFAAPSVQALSFSNTAEVSAGVVFAGYGIVVPDSQTGYDSYAGLSVSGKVVVVLRYFPEDADDNVRSLLARYSDLRYKALAARERGAIGLVVVTGPRSPNAGRTVPMNFDTALAGSGIPAASVDAAVTAALFEGREPLETIQRSLDTGNPHVTGFDFPGIRLTLTAAVERERRTGYNVLAYLPATVAVAGVAKPWVAVGAHYDHLGRGGRGNSLATADERDAIHAGADDNASGTAAVLAIGRALADEPRSRHVLLAFWSAEEIGLVGSTAFIAAAPVPIVDIAAYLNYDMIGRMQNNRLAIQATGTSPAWPAVLERANVTAGFDAVLQADPYQPTDVATFNASGVPSLSFTTGTHADYHKPSDTAEKINADDLDRIADMGASIVRQLLTREAPLQFAKIEEPASRSAPRTGLRVFTGTVPDYTTETEGLVLGGVVAGGPAEQAGLQKGDIIIEIGGQSITNIYDYTYALERLRIGETTRVVYRRSGERRETTLTPVARP